MSQTQQLDVQGGIIVSEQNIKDNPNDWNATQTFLKRIVVTGSDYATTSDLSAGSSASTAQYLWIMANEDTTGLSTDNLLLGANLGNGCTIAIHGDHIGAELAWSSAAYYAVAYYDGSTNHVVFQIGDGVSNPYVTRTQSRALNVSTTSTTPYTVADSDDMILASAGASALVLNLPAANAVSGRRLIIAKSDSGAGAVTVTPNGSDTIDGSTSALLVSTQYEKTILVSDGVSNWYNLGASLV